MAATLGNAEPPGVVNFKAGMPRSARASPTHVPPKTSIRLVTLSIPATPATASSAAAR
jgi:hypothetical protein